MLEVVGDARERRTQLLCLLTPLDHANDERIEGRALRAHGEREGATGGRRHVQRGAGST